MTETPDMVYGRLLESAHISGYGFERVCDELSWLMANDRWQAVGPGYEDFGMFLGTVDLSPFKMESAARKSLVKQMTALQASQRQTAKALGVGQSTVQRDLDEKPSDPVGSPEPPEPTRTAADEKPSDPVGSPEPFQQPASAVAKQARKSSNKAKAAADTVARREASRSAEPLPDGVDFRIGDAREQMAGVGDDSIALVLTDPPYGDEAEPLYRWLGEWAARVLIPGGSLICYTGQSRLDRDMQLIGEHLRWWWLMSMPHHQSQRLPGKFVIAEFKPVMWHVKDRRRGRTLVNDVLRSEARDKATHRWGQGEGGVGLLIEQLTDPGDWIADPFAGTGRWGRIAADMGRRWVGSDIEPGGSERAVA